MEPLLTIDSGNTNTTIGLYPKGSLEVVSLDKFDKSLNSEVKTVFYSSVGSPIDKWEGPQFKNIKDFIKDKSLLNMPINYSESIGDDRLAASYWTFQNYIKTKKVNRAMIVDAGTFTTLDLVTTDGFEGGHIFPGTKTLLDTFRRGAKLPGIDLTKQTSDQIIPKTTAEAMKSSVQLAERGLYEKWWELFRPEIIILSGGLSSWHQNYFPSEHVLKPYIVHLGLQELYNNSAHQ